MDGEGTKWRRNIAKKFQPAEQGARALQTTDDRQTDGPATAYSERERELVNVR